MNCCTVVWVTDGSKGGYIVKPLPICDSDLYRHKDNTFSAYRHYSAAGRHPGSVLVSCREKTFNRHYLVTAERITQALESGKAVLSISREDSPKLFMTAYTLSKDEPSCVSVADYISRDNGKSWRACDPDISFFRIPFSGIAESIFKQQFAGCKIRIM
ncbi:MAG: hypothetical protein NC078_01770 [Ruminococcus sp.]|nr:hypothetical protein [Ruminococcus sp.]